ncbi:MAG: hypothetical protein F4X44_02685 [Gammaproteobacteria bacterium]|nr:hypothetical protein [Gammaproteobacteria bacterium]
MDHWPNAVLSQRVVEALQERRLRSALFTTYTFDPGFFELEVLPLLFRQSFSQAEKVKLLQLEDALRDVDHIAVYYDRNALSQDATPARLDYRRIDVRRRGGVFHPKLAFFLLDEKNEVNRNSNKNFQSLVIACLSANLTRSGWWENVECAHFVEISDRSVSSNPIPYRSDLLAILRRIRACGTDSEDHSALESIRSFLRNRVSSESIGPARVRGRWTTRMFGGERQLGISDWLEEQELTSSKWNLEIISPFFDSRGAHPLNQLTRTIQPVETRVFLPREPDGSALVTENTYESISALNGVKWSVLPSQITKRSGGASGEKLAPRYVHAKVYRFWNSNGREVVLIGSANCTSSAHSHGGAGNLEAAFLVDLSRTRRGPNDWWLQPLGQDVQRFAEESPGESDGLDDSPIGVSIRYDWGTRELAVRLDRKTVQPLSVSNSSGGHLFNIEATTEKHWCELDTYASDLLRKSLQSSSFVVLNYGEIQWKVLVREEGMAHRPSILSELSPEEILEYWSLLTIEERAEFLERHAAFNENIEGLPVLSSNIELGAETTVFDRFAAVFHAFGCLKRHTVSSLENGRFDEAEMRLLGAKYDSLPELLRKLLDLENGDPIQCYVSFLTAKQMRDSLGEQYGEFFRDREDLVTRLDILISEGLCRREQIFEFDEKQSSDFLEWFEPVFLRDLSNL